MVTHVSQDFQKQVEGFGLTTAHVVYYCPDARNIINPNWILWQEYDLFPKFPRLMQYLDYWKEKIEGPLHSVKVMHNKLIKPAELQVVGGEFRLH